MELGRLMKHVAGRKYWSLDSWCWYAAQLVDVTCKLPIRPITLSGVWYISDPWRIHRVTVTVLSVYVGETDCGYHDSEPNVATVVYIARRKQRTKTLLYCYNICMFSLKYGSRERNRRLWRRVTEWSIVNSWSVERTQDLKQLYTSGTFLCVRVQFSRYLTHNLVICICCHNNLLTR